MTDNNKLLESHKEMVGAMIMCNGIKRDGKVKTTIQKRLRFQDLIIR